MYNDRSGIHNQPLPWKLGPQACGEGKMDNPDGHLTVWRTGGRLSYQYDSCHHLGRYINSDVDPVSKQ